ncbi:Eco57I restriction-modification methylase domain-containing protein [Candidatus Margulisiibacteriota bacterium]
MNKDVLQSIIDDFSLDKFNTLFRAKNPNYTPRQEPLSNYNEDGFADGVKLGEINFGGGARLYACAFKTDQILSERSSRKAQYEIGRKVLKEKGLDAGIFIFYDQAGDFRFSLIYPVPMGNRRQWSNFRRFTYFVSKDPEITNKTFIKQVGDGEWLTIDKIKEAFALGPVTDLFYQEFFKEYKKLLESVEKKNSTLNHDKARDFALLFVIRTIFIGFIQKKGWIGNNNHFLKDLIKEYEIKYSGRDLFYKRWLRPLLFEALNSEPGRKVAYGDNDFSKQTEENMQMAPYLKGLFKEKPGYDDQRIIIPDKDIKSFYAFLFSYNFTIEENSLVDEELQLNPEFLGIIFERLVSKADGTVYTPRTEVDLMCRLSLIKWLEKNITTNVSKRNLYELIFREGEKEEDQKHGSFTPKQVKEIIGLIENIVVCDPAVGSGAFLIGMIQVIDEIEQILNDKIGIHVNHVFERKKRIISRSLYGVEVQEWAVWICQLRLWLSLFVDADDKEKTSLKPILPSLDFKVYRGDSLVQRIGTKAFPVMRHAAVSESMKRKIAELKRNKADYFNNKSKLSEKHIHDQELALFENIIQSEIKENKRKIDEFRGALDKKSPLPGILPPQPKQSKLPFELKYIKQLENEIEELVEQKKLIYKEKPFIWNIAFPEIFTERKGFDIVIGNPPYVRQEDISDPTGKIKDKKKYKDCLAEMVRIDFPTNFPPKSKIDAKSDLYAYFYIRALRLLNPNGIHTFICSNSWLDVGYGAWLQQFFLKMAPIECIIDNHSQRSFEAADVNTIISVIFAPMKNVNHEHLVRFIAFKMPFEESIFTEYLLQIEAANDVQSNDVFRVYPITIKGLKEAGTDYQDDAQRRMGIGDYVGDKWGAKYLRAPDIFFKILYAGKQKLVRLGNIAHVVPGCYSGINDFFYLNYEYAKKHKIDKQYLLPLIRSSNDVITLKIGNISKYFVLSIPQVKKDKLPKSIVDYISWGEKQKTRKRQKTKAGIPWPKTETVKNRKYWYSIPENNLKKAKVFMQYVANDRFYCPYADNGVVSDRCFHRIILNDDNLDKKYVFVLNSTLQMFFVMLLGRAGLGLGALKYEAKDANNVLVFDPNNLNVEEADIETIIEKIGSRKALSVFDECGIDPESSTPIELQEPKPLKDRASLDKLIYDALGLTDEERKEVYRAVCRLVWNRISKAKSV